MQTQHPDGGLVLFDRGRRGLALQRFDIGRDRDGLYVFEVLITGALDPGHCRCGPVPWQHNQLGIGWPLCVDIISQFGLESALPKNDDFAFKRATN